MSGKKLYFGNNACVTLAGSQEGYARLPLSHVWPALFEPFGKQQAAGDGAEKPGLAKITS